MNPRASMIYIVDDNASVGRSLQLLLKPHGFRIETFTSALEFLEFKHLKTPSCLLLDIRMPDINGFELQATMASRQIDVPIIFISGHGNIPISVKAMKAGAVDFLVKPFTEKNLLNAIGLALEKNKFQRKRHAQIDTIHHRLRLLSPREREVFRLVAQGMLSKEIAFKLGIVLQTAKVHRGRVMQKMQAKTVTELIQMAQKVGIVPPEN
jgi:FixJ family two-component response regulator